MKLLLLAAALALLVGCEATSDQLKKVACHMNPDGTMSCQTANPLPGFGQPPPPPPPKTIEK